MPKPAKSASILIVDDNQLGTVAQRSVLEELGHRVYVAKSGEQALELYRSQGFDIVITDYNMPKMDGVELIRKLRKSDPNARIILISGFVDTLRLTEQDTGADVVIQKSSHEVGVMIRAVAKLLKRSTTKSVGHQRNSKKDEFEISLDHELSPHQVKAALATLADYYRACGGVGLDVKFEREEAKILERVHA
jgi:CheY-like chemotaxis protein